MTKTELYTTINTEITNLFADHKKLPKAFKEDLMTIIDTHLKPKSGGGSQNPPILNEDGTIKEAWCRWHQRYEPVEDMVISNGKSKGYCKASISRWTKGQRIIKQKESEITECILGDNAERAKEIAEEVKFLKDEVNKPEYYDYEADWAEFAGSDKSPQGED